MGKLQVIVGGQFGSEAKGAVAGYLAKREPNLLAIRVAGPNAGHTVYDEKGVRHALRQLPVAAISNPNAKLAIAAGSEIDPDVLYQEVKDCDASRRLLIDDQATTIEDGHKEAEGYLVGKIGSTGKGIGAARSDRIMRSAKVWGGGGDVAYRAMEHLATGGTVQVEGAQGFGLGLHAGFYPFCTSSDCRAIDFLAMAGISPWFEHIEEFEVWVVIRPFPIRVAGNSGPLKDETTWAELGLPEEFTTVTQKVRRVGQFDPALVRNAIWANGGRSKVHVAMSMLDQLWPEVKGALSESELSVQSLETLHLMKQTLDLPRGIELVGTSPTTIVDRRYD